MRQHQQQRRIDRAPHCHCGHLAAAEFGVGEGHRGLVCEVFADMQPCQRYVAGQGFGREAGKTL
jgi:hypothetical protein